MNKQELYKAYIEAAKDEQFMAYMNESKPPVLTPTDIKTWLKEQPDTETSPIRKHTKALGEASYELERLERENMELKHQIRELQLQVGDWKDVAEQLKDTAEQKQTIDEFDAYKGFDL